MGHASAQALFGGLLALLLNIQEPGKLGAGFLAEGRVPAWIKLVCVDGPQTTTAYFVRHSSGDETIHVDQMVALVTGQVVELDFLEIVAETLTHNIIMLISRTTSSVAVSGSHGDPKIMDCPEVWAARYN